MTASPDETLRATAERLIERAAKATKGKWASKPSVHGNKYRYVQIGKDDAYTTLELEPADARFIEAAQPSTITALARAYLELLSKEPPR